MAVVVGRMVAVLEAQTAAFEARMSAAGQQLGRFTSVTGQAHRGASLLRGGLQQLAFEGLGGMPPALARVSTGMITLFGGGGIMLGAVAVLGALAMAFQHAAKKAEEFEEENRRVRDFTVAHNKVLAGIGPGLAMTPSEQLAQLQILRGRAVLFQEGLRAGAGGPLMELLSSHGSSEAQVATNRITALTLAIQGFDRAIQDVRRSMGMPVIWRAIEHEIVSNARQRLFDWSGRGAVIEGGRLDKLNMPSTIRQPIPVGVFQSPVTAPGPGNGNALQIAQMAAASVMLVAQGGGGALGAGGMFLTGLSGMKGIGAAAGPLGWAGLAFSTLGGLFGGRDGIERRHREEMEELRRIRENTTRRGQPDKISVYINGKEISGAILDDVIYGIRRAERTNATPILPPS